MNNRELAAEIAKELLEMWDVGHGSLLDREGFDHAEEATISDLIYGVLNREWPD